MRGQERREVLERRARERVGDDNAQVKAEMERQSMTARVRRGWWM